MAETWNILVVDDEPDVHMVTKMALRRFTWKDRGFAMVSVMSAKDARDALAAPGGAAYHVALVDVVMETDTAGLELCNYIRERCPPWLRIVLRTGQAGKAPELEVLAEYDIDYYLSKLDATPERMFAVIRACLNCGEAIRTLAAKSG